MCCHMPAVALQANRYTAGQFWHCILEGESYSSYSFPHFQLDLQGSKKMGKGWKMA